MNPRLRIRTAETQDTPTLAHLRYRFRAELGEATEPKADFVQRCTAWMVARLSPAGPWRCWVAESEQGIIGHLWLQVIEKIPNPIAEPEYHAYVTNCYVLPRARGRGVGASLLETALTWCREAGVDAIVLWPTEKSRSLYLRHGFAVRDDLLELRLFQPQ
ncbi:MAG TPA: GNAT family N-acetyltransferase [Anaerolineae bacterium]